MMNKLKRYIYIDPSVEYSNGLSVKISNSTDGNWEIIDDFSKFNEVSKTSKNLESAFIVTENREKYKDLLVSNNIIDSKRKNPEKIINEIRWIMKDRKSEGKIFLTSDQHFNHKNIIKYCDRPWNSGHDENGEMIITDEDVGKMNQDMIDRWNSVVSPEDTVYHLGDFALGDRKKIPELRSKLNGKIHLVLGNHDFFHINDKNKYRDVVDFFYKSGFERVYDKPVLLDNFMILSHEPLMWVKEPIFNIFGHIHQTDTFKTISKNGCCVCVERWDYTPVSLDTIKEMYENL
jgi:calcineurin-like phosphoesterase family protein